MQRLSHPTARFLRQIVFERGHDWQRRLWLAHLENAPRYEPDRSLNPCPAPVPWPDDGQGPIPLDLRIALLGCLHLEAGTLLDRLCDPAISEDEAADLSNDYTYVSGLLKWFDAAPETPTDTASDKPEDAERGLRRDG